MSSKPPDHLSGPCVIADAIRRAAIEQGVDVETLCESTNKERRHMERFLMQRESTNTRCASRLFRLLGLRITGPAESGEEGRG